MRNSWSRNNHKLERFERRFYPNKNAVVAGVDEAGRGPLAGPVVAAAVILKNKSFHTRICDSKLLSARARKRAFAEISENAYIGVGVVENKEIDDINIYRATIAAMKKALLRLSVKPEFVLIDGVFNNAQFPYEFKTVISGDNLCLCVACASIVAKVVRDDLMSRYALLYPDYGFEHNRGYGTKQHINAIQRFGVTPLHRISFNPIRSALKKKMDSDDPGR